MHFSYATKKKNILAYTKQNIITIHFTLSITNPILEIRSVYTIFIHCDCCAQKPLLLFFLFFPSKKCYYIFPFCSPSVSCVFMYVYQITVMFCFFALSSLFFSIFVIITYLNTHRKYFYKNKASECFKVENKTCWRLEPKHLQS